MHISNRQINILKTIIEEYTLTAQPVSSKSLVEKYFKNLSAQTLRNEMNALEKMGLLEKTYTSSGRIPSVNGYKYYESNILKPFLSSNIKNKLRVILEKRNMSIDTIIDESASLIEEIIQLPTVIVSQDNNLLLKRFDLVPISNNKVLVMLITSNGEITKNTIDITDPKQLDDVVICINIFNDRLIDTPISQVSEKLLTIKELIRNSVYQYEFCIQKIITKIFEFNKITQKHNIFGIRNLATQPEFQNSKKLHEVLKMLENASVWKHIAYTQEKSGKAQITFGENIGEKDITIASTSIETKNVTRQISIVGPTRMNYVQIKGLLEFMKEELEKISAGKK